MAKTGRILAWGAAAVAALAFVGPVHAQDDFRTRPVNSYGVPGIIDTPSAEMQPDGHLVNSIYMLTNSSGRTQLTFQITPRLQGSFRYATLPNFLPIPGTTSFERTYDRSFDLRYQLFRENGWRPAVTVGLQDFGGTSLFSAEYVVATKHFGDRLTVSGGIGWGRLGSRGSFSNPLNVFSDRFRTRPAFNPATTGGTFSSNQLFRGPAALFGGVTYQFNDRLLLKAEYSSDAYAQEIRQGIFESKTPINVGFDYAWRPGRTLSGYVVNGSEVGLQLTFALNPRRSPVGTGFEPAPIPVILRPSREDMPEAWTTAWEGNEAIERPLFGALQQAMAEEGLILTGYNASADRAEVRFRNERYQTQTQAMGRAARLMSAALPPSVETFVLVPESDVGLTAAAVVVRRSDLEALQYAPNGSAELQAVAGLVDAATLDEDGLTRPDGFFPRFQWRLGPYLGYSLFDPDSPLRLDLGVEVAAKYEPTPGLVLSGAVRQRLVGNRDGSTRPNNSVLTRVRTDSDQFAKTDGPFIDHLTAEYFFRPGRSLYGRLSAGLLEQQFGGVSAEMLWKPVGSRLALGVEVNRVRQRDFDMQFGFRNIEATTGFVSAYLDHGNSFYSQLDVGQYLAGDRGATYTLTREFSNGWELGAFASATNVSAAQFGEGSFDKGFFLKIPASWLTGQPSRTTFDTLIRPTQRDGAQRLRLENRLYPMVREQSDPVLSNRWGRFWR